jgi:hypothetical protein
MHSDFFSSEADSTRDTPPPQENAFGANNFCQSSDSIPNEGDARPEFDRPTSAPFADPVDDVGTLTSERGGCDRPEANEANESSASAPSREEAPHSTSSILFALDLLPHIPPVAVRALLQSIGYRNAYHTGYNLPEEKHTTKLTTEVYVSTRHFNADAAATITRRGIVRTAVTLNFPLAAVPRQPQHTFLEDAAPLRLFDTAAFYSPSGYRWATFDKVDNDRAAAAGVDVSSFTMDISIDVFDRGDSILLDDRDGELRLGEPKSIRLADGGTRLEALVIVGRHAIARVTGPLQSWARYHPDESTLEVNATRANEVTIEMIDGPQTTTTAFISIFLRLSFSNFTLNPVDGRRRIAVKLRDGKTGRTARVERRVRVVPVDDITQMDLRSAGPTIYRCPNDPPVHYRHLMPPEQPVYVAPHAEVTDPDSDIFIGGYLEATIVRGDMPGDYLFFLSRTGDDPDALEVDIDEDEKTKQPCTLVKCGSFAARLRRGHVLTGVPAPFLRRTARTKRRSSVAPTAAASCFSDDDHKFDHRNRRPSNVSQAKSEDAVELVQAQNKRVKTPPPDGPGVERRILIRFDIIRGDCAFLQSLIRSIAFKPTEKQIGTRAVEFRLIAGDPFEIKFRKFNAHIPITGRSIVAVCEPLIVAPPRPVVYTEGKGLMALQPSITVVEENSLGYRPWTNGWVKATIVHNYSIDEDRLGLRSYDQSVIDGGLTLIEQIPDHARDADFVTSVKPTDLKSSSRRDRTEELQLAALVRHLGTLRPTERAQFERHYDAVTYERQPLCQVRCTYQTVSAAFRQDIEVNSKRKKRNPTVSTPSAPSSPRTPRLATSFILDRKMAPSSSLTV